MYALQTYFEKVLLIRGQRALDRCREDHLIRNSYVELSLSSLSQAFTIVKSYYLFKYLVPIESNIIYST